MGIKDLRDLSKKVSESKRQESRRLESEKKKEYSGLADELNEKRKAVEEKTGRPDPIRQSFKKNLPTIKVVALAILVVLILFQFYRLFGPKKAKSPFKEFAPMYAKLKEDETADVGVFFEKVLSAYAKDGTKGLEVFWDDKLPAFVISESNEKISKFKDVKGLSVNKVILEKTLSSYMVYFSAGTGKGGGIMRIVKKADGSFRLTGID